MSEPPTPDLHRELITLFSAMEEGVIVTDPAGRIAFANASVARMMGIAAPEMVSEAELASRVLFLDPDGQPIPSERLPDRLALEGRAPARVEMVRRLRSTGEESWLTATATSLTDDGGRGQQVVTIYRDVTPLRRADRAMRFLAGASATLSSSLEYDATLEALARLAVPAFADCCSVEILEADGSCRQAGVAHVEPGKMELIREIRLRNPLRIDSQTGPGHVLRSGKPLFVPFIPEERLRAITRDPEDLRILLELGLKSSIAVPLSARGRTLGLLTLYSVQRGRLFDEEDLAVAIELANRAALAVDNARLYEEARAALLRKDEEARLNDTLRRLGNIFAAELDSDRLVQLITDEATSLVGARSGVFLRREDGASFRPIPSGEASEAFLRFVRAGASSLFGPTCRKEDILRFGDPAQRLLYLSNAPPPGIGGAEPAERSLLAVPIFSRQGWVLGGLVFGDPRLDAFTSHHERMALGIAAQAAIALDNAFLFEQLRDAKEQFRASEERLRMAVAAGQMGYFDLDIATKRVSLSSRFEAMLGMPSGTFDGTRESIARCLHPDDAWPTLDRIKRIAKEERDGESFVCRAVHPDGSIHWIESYSKLVRDDGERAVRLLGIGMDVTERYKAQEEVRRLVDELQRSNSELEQFAYVASHDLQEPLRMVASYVQLLARRYQGRLDADADEFIRYAVDGTGRMRRLISDLLTYSRVGTQSKPLAPVAFREVLERALGNLQAAAEEAGASISTDESFPVVMGDEVQLEQLLQNLLGNALKFRGDRPPRVHVGVERREGEEVFYVRDNGIGIDPQHFERLFIIFQRLHERDAYPGTGIGLAVCKRIVERHGGRIWVESTPGEGATFLFKLKVLAQARAAQSA